LAEERITVQSITGVDLTLTLAGPGTRSYAFIIDWHIRVLLSGAWLLVAAASLGFHLSWKSSSALLTILPALVLYFLYHPIVEIAMRGQTPGKKVAGVRILSRSGGQPSVGALLIRNIFRPIDSLPAFYLLGLVTCIFSAHRVRVGDLAAGTLLVLDHRADEQALARVESMAGHSSLPLETLELADQILERWDALQPESRADIARSLLVQVLAPADGVDLPTWSDARLRAQLRALLGPGTLTHG
jgi:uncharacterized RDD family membrane protein YckC